MASSPDRLWTALDFPVSKLVRFDFVIGLLGGGGALWLALENPDRLQQIVAPVGLSVIGVMIGAVVAASAVLAAFLNQPFLRKLKAIGREPVRYLRPFLFTAALGVIASLCGLAVIAMPSDPRWLLGAGSFAAGLFSVWAIASVLPDLTMLVQFIGLQFDATDVPDEAVADPPAR